MSADTASPFHASCRRNSDATDNSKGTEWIHDCDLLALLYDASSESSRLVKVTVRCPANLGYSPWEGKTLQLVAVDVALMKHVVCGVAGPETIDAIRSGISKDSREITVQAKTMGVRFPSLEFTISFQSGFGLEVICEGLQIDVESAGSLT